MTPDEARRSIHDAEDLRANLPIDCWRALETVAGMHEEWGVSHDGLVVEWSRDQALMRKRANAMNRRGSRPVRVVRRYVTEPEAVE